MPRLRCGSPTTWGNVQRRYKALAPPAAANPAAAQPAAGRPSSRAQRMLTAASALLTPNMRQHSSAATPPSAAAQSTRAGSSGQLKRRRTSEQLQTDVSNVRRRRAAYVAAHKAATLEYAAAEANGKGKRQGFTAESIAAKHDNTLSPENPNKITGLRRR